MMEKQVPDMVASFKNSEESKKGMGNDQDGDNVTYSADGKG